MQSKRCDLHPKWLHCETIDNTLLLSLYHDKQSFSWWKKDYCLDKSEKLHSLWNPLCALFSWIYCVQPDNALITNYKFFIISEIRWVHTSIVNRPWICKVLKFTWDHVWFLTCRLKSCVKMMCVSYGKSCVFWHAK